MIIQDGGRTIAFLLIENGVQGVVGAAPYGSDGYGIGYGERGVVGAAPYGGNEMK